MTNSEANNSQSATQVASKTNAWHWLTDRLPAEGLGQLDSWLAGELLDLETAWEHMASPNSRKRELRQEFQDQRRSAN